MQVGVVSSGANLPSHLHFGNAVHTCDVMALLGQIWRVCLVASHTQNCNRRQRCRQQLTPCRPGPPAPRSLHCLQSPLALQIAQPRPVNCLQRLPRQLPQHFLHSPTQIQQLPERLLLLLPGMEANPGLLPMALPMALHPRHSQCPQQQPGSFLWPHQPPRPPPVRFCAMCIYSSLRF